VRGRRGKDARRRTERRKERGIESATGGGREKEVRLNNPGQRVQVAGQQASQDSGQLLINLPLPVATSDGPRLETPSTPLQVAHQCPLPPPEILNHQ
jgi:hypothetical protein